MRNAKSRIFAAVVGTLSMGAAAAWAADSQEAQIQQLESKVAALEAKQAASSKDMAATIDSMLRDAEKRSQLLATSGEASAGYDNGFFIKAGDAWVLRPFALFQFRNVTDYRSDVTHKGDSTDNGFEIARMRFGLEGTAFSRDLEYSFIWESFADDGSLNLSDAWARYMFADEWGARAGQFRDLTTHEWLTNDGRLLAVDRSLTDALIGGQFSGYTQGVTGIYGGQRPNNPLNVEVGYTDGMDQANTSFVGRPTPREGDAVVPEIGPVGPHTLDWGITGRVEYKVMGNWLDYADFTAKGDREDLLVVGAGGDWSQGGDGDIFLGTIDAQYENTGGLGVYAAGLYRRLDSEVVGTGDSGDDWGGLIQAGYMLSPNWEVFGRYDITYLDRVAPVGQDEHTFQELTIGVNYYLGNDGSARHRAKVTVDLSYLPNGAPAGFETLDVLDMNEAQAEWLLRAQFQLWI